MEERAQMDSAALFAMIFGSEKFIPLGAPEIGYSYLAIIPGYCKIHLTSLFVNVCSGRIEDRFADANEGK